MENALIEMLVKAKTTQKGWMCRVLGITLTILCVFVMLIVGPLGLLLAFLFGYLTYKVWQLTDIEYEYSYFGGEVTIDKIMGQEKRKRMIEFALNECEAAGYEDSEKLAYYKNNKFEVLDLTTGEAGHRRFLAVLCKDGKQRKIYFEPDEKMVQAMKNIAPNIVSVR